jgi:hypothetical protein
MDSPGHRKNTLLDEVNCVGVGLGVAADGTFWITEEFAQESGDGPLSPGSTRAPGGFSLGPPED